MQPNFVVNEINREASDEFPITERTYAKWNECTRGIESK